SSSVQLLASVRKIYVCGHSTQRHGGRGDYCGSMRALSVDSSCWRSRRASHFSRSPCPRVEWLLRSASAITNSPSSVQLTRQVLGLRRAEENLSSPALYR